MLTSKRITPRICVALVITLLLGACGGGGSGNANSGGSGSGGGVIGSPDLQYTGATSPANLQAATTPHIAGALLFELGIASTARPISIRRTDKQLTAISRKTLLATKSRRVSAAKIAAQAVKDESCAGGGSIRIDDRTSVAGTGTITMAYTACVEEGVRTDGTLRVQIYAYSVERGQPTDFTTRFEAFSVTEGSFITDLGGTVRSVLTDTGLTTTYNAVTRYRPEGVEHRLVNMVVQERALVMSGDSEIIVQGQFFHSAYGYVDVETVNALTANLSAEFASAGSLRLRGEGTTVAQINYLANDYLELSLDENGDGVVERTLRSNASTLSSTENYVPVVNAGPDASILEGNSIVIDGSLTSDWDGNALTYEWYIQSGPTGSGLKIGSQSRITFQAEVAGTYSIELRASDGGTSIGFDVMTLTVIDNIPPFARAGADVTAVEKGSVLLDGSSSTDVEKDAINYRWTLTSAPAGSSAPVSATSATFSVAADRPGTYVYTLRAADTRGFSEDTVSIQVEPLLRIYNNVTFDINPATTLQQATQTVPLIVSSLYAGSPVSFTASSNVPWMKVISSSGTTAGTPVVVVRIEPAAIQTFNNGSYQGALTVSPVDYTADTRAAFAFIALPRVSHISPYVTYANTTSPVTLYGDFLHLTYQGTLIINGTEVQGFSNEFVNQTQITLPPLPAGEYSVRIKNNLGIVQPMSRVVVRPAPTYPDVDAAIDGRVESFEYDAERDVFYVVSWDLDYAHTNQIHRLRFDGSTWQKDTIAAVAPQAVSLDVDGNKLLVTAANCTVLEFDPDTLALLLSTTKPSCSSEVFGLVHGVADARVLVGDTNQWPTVWTYPSYTQCTLPSAHSPVHLLNYDRNRMLWAEAPTISAPNELYLYNAIAGTSQEISVHDSDAHFLPGLLAISGDGARIMHRRDVYQEGQYIGSLQAASHPYLAPALTRAGSRAVVLQPDTDTLSLYDLTHGPNFAKITDVSVLGDVGYANRIALLPNDRVAFLFTSLTSIGGNTTFRLYVRNLP
jgi:hypothetical protein